MMVQNHGNGKIVTSGIDFIATYGSLPTEGKSGHNHELSSLLKIVLRELELSCSDEDDSVSKKSTVGFIMGDPKVRKVSSDCRFSVELLILFIAFQGSLDLLHVRSGILTKVIKRLIGTHIA